MKIIALLAVCVLAINAMPTSPISGPGPNAPSSQSIDVFGFVDSNGNGKISRKEFKKFLILSGASASDSETVANLMVGMGDRNGDKQLNRAEFAPLMNMIKQQQQAGSKK